MATTSSVFKKVVTFSTILLSLFLFGQSRGQNLDESILKEFKYREIGPTRQGGRFVDFAVPENEPFTFYAATASGGLWKTSNNGITFEPIFDQEEVISIGDIAVAPSDGNIVWVGSGEANNSRSCYWGNGVYKSTNAGKTWKNMGLKESHHIGRIVIHPTNPDIVYVAALGHLYSENKERGLYKTTNGGKSWKKVLDVKSHGKQIGAVDVVMDPTNSDILYAATYDKERKPWTFNLGGPGSGIYKTTDAGKNWKKLGGGLPTGMLGRIGLTIYPKNPKILYTIIENANKPDMSDEDRLKELRAGKSSKGIIGNEVYRTDDGGETWKKVNKEKQSLGGSPPYYYGQIRVDPNDENHLYNLMVSVVESKDGGQTWKRAFRFGGDNHALWINPKNSNHILLGYDHGMGITYDGGKNWFHPDYLPLAQYYAVSVDMEYPYNVYGGLQDNGSVKGPGTKRGGGAIYFEDWQRVGGGDGFYNVVDPSDSRWLYNESQFCGGLARVDQVTGERVNIRPTDKKLRFNWSTPILISPHNPKTIYLGANKLLRSKNRGDNWEEVSPDLTDPDSTKLTVNGKGGDGNIQYSTISTLDESPLEAGVIWVGTDDGNVQVTRDGGKNWTKLNGNIKGNPGYWVSRVIASNHFPGTAYVSYTGYRRDDFKAFLYKTTDYGETWKSIAANLPDEPINVIREDRKNSNLLFVGTEFGVYVSINGAKNWTKMKNNMPTQPVHDLLIHPRENDLVVATHGRGIFITDISPLQELTKEILAKDVHLFDVEPKIKWKTGISNQTAYNNFTGESEPNGVVINYYLKNKVKDGVEVKIFKGNLQVNELEGGDSTGVNRVVWNMTKKRKRTEKELEKLKERLRGRRELTDRDKFEMIPMQPGEYKIVLVANGKKLSKKAVILHDHWFK